MKETFIVLSIFFVFKIGQTASAEDFRSLQRYQFVATADEGKSVAILLSHFGPSSQAPFVNLIVKQIENPSVELIDSKLAFQGSGEEALQRLENHVLLSNKQKLKDRGFVFTSEGLSEMPSFWHGAIPTTGYVDTKDDTTFKTLRASPISLECPNGAQGMNWKVCSGTGKCAEVRAEQTVACHSLSVVPQKVFRVGKVLWVVAYRKMKALSETTAVVAEFAGIELSN